MDDKTWRTCAADVGVGHGHGTEVLGDRAPEVDGWPSTVCDAEEYSHFEHELGVTLYTAA